MNWRGWVLLISVWIALAGTGPKRLESLPPVCLSRALLDRPCAGCGITRAMAHLSRFDLRQAQTAHPWAVAVALAGVFLVLRKPRRRPKPEERGNPG